MNLTYARVYAELWDSSVAKLDDCARAMAVFLMSARGVNPFGLYYKPVVLIAKEFERSEDVVRKAMADLMTIDFCRFDDATSAVWVVKMAEHQFRPLPLKPGNLAVRGARRWYATLPRNPFMGAWWDTYHELFLLDDSRSFPGSEVSRREWTPREIPAVNPPPPPPAPAPLPTPEQLELVSPPAKPASNAVAKRAKYAAEDEFELWWAAYPDTRKEGRAPTLAKWKLKQIPVENVPAMIEKLHAQIRSPKWREGFVPMPLTYVNQERWNDEIAPEPARSRVSRTNQRTIDTLADITRELNPHDEDR